MKPINIGGHSAYQNSLVDLLCKYYPDPDMLSPSTWDTIERFYRKDLSRIDGLTQDRYSVFGPAPRLPSCMVRSLIVALEFDIASYSTLADALKITPLYAILSGFSPRGTPGVGTFYDFIDRLWLSDSASFNEHVHLPKKKVEKPSRKGDKAASIEKVTVDDLIGEFSSHSPQTDTPFSLIFDIFKELFLDESVERGLIDPSALSVAGDGTPVRTACMERRKRICECDGKRDCPRHYSQPDCDYGWDSHRKCFYFGYDLYLFTYPCGDSDLPIFPALFPASKRDSLAFVHTWFASRSFLPEFHVSKLFLDSAQTLCQFMNFAAKTGRLLLWTLIIIVARNLFTKTTSPSIPMAFPFAKQVFVCAMMVLKRKSIVPNSDALFLTEFTVVPVKRLALIPNMAEPFTLP